MSYLLYPMAAAREGTPVSDGAHLPVLSRELQSGSIDGMDVLVDLGDNCGMTQAIDRNIRNLHVVEPPQDPSEVLELARFLGDQSAPATLVGPDGEQVSVPVEVYEVLLQVVDAMERGASVSVERIDRQLTTQQAADLLGVSRNTLVRMLGENELPYERFGQSRHRRLRLGDVLAYRDRKRVERRERMDELTRQAVEDGLYDVDSDSYQKALSDARKS